MERRSESPADSIDMTPTRKSLPAAVPRATFEPWYRWTGVLLSMA